MTTKHDLFEQWKGTTSEASWNEHWLNIWMKELTNDIINRKWTLLPIEHQSKRPIQKGWPERHLELIDAIHDIKLNHNIAVNLGKSNLVAFDYDAEPTEDHILLSQFTLTMNTARGIQYFVMDDGTEIAPLNMQFDKPRHNNMYSLIPYSETCTKADKETGYCLHNDAHDYRVRTWLNEMEPITLKEFLEIIQSI